MDDPQSTTQGSEFAAQTDEVESAGAEEAAEPLSSRIAGFLRTCWVRRKMVFGILFTGILVSVIYSLSQPNVYTSTTTLLPSDSGSPYSSIMNLLSPGSSAAEPASIALGLETPGELFISILKSRNVQDGLINRLDLAHYYNTHSIEDTRRALAGDTEIEEDRKSGVITISVTAANPVFASKMAQGYVEELNRVVTDSTTSAAHRERIFLEGRVNDVKQKLDESAKELSRFSAKSGAIDMASQTRSMVDEGLRLQAELIDGRSQLAALRQNYSEDNSRVRALEAHNAELQRQLDKMGGLSQKSGANGDANKASYPSAGELPVLALTYYDLERKVSVEEALWEALTKQYEAAKVEEAEEIPAVRVLDVANVPERKSGPSRRSIVEAGALLSLVAAFIAVLVGMMWEAMDPQEEPKRLLTEGMAAALSSRRWYWALPGMSWIHRRLMGSEGSG
jgi:uncharacterized protein involved in exopolysaccharide biosynthesis